jgi:tRNA nucleotidyltransferase (CCA-adding enzyme)
VRNFGDFLGTIAKILPQIKALAALGATSYLVGGCTRDLLLGKPIYDLDIEVHGLGFAELEKALARFGQLCCTGKVFMVIKTPQNGIDWSIPRLDGCGRKPKVHPNKNLNIAAAAKRRDLTINAIYLDLNQLAIDWYVIQSACQLGKTPAQVLHFQDPFQGIKDLKNKVLRAVDPHFFIQDPLRFFRVMQFAARFAMTPNTELDKICREMLIVLDNPSSEHYVSPERINQELCKMLLKSEQPSIGLYWLFKTGRLREFFPEFASVLGSDSDCLLVGKDSFDHLCKTVDAAARTKVISNEQPSFANDQEKLALCLAALLHNVALNPLQDGTLVVQGFLERLKFSNQINAQVCKLIKFYKRVEEIRESPLSEYKFLASDLAPEISLRQLAMLALFEKQGQALKSDAHKLLENYQIFLARATSAGVLERPEAAVLSGRDLTGKLKPGPEMGKLLKLAYHLQIAEGVKNKAELLEKLVKE